MVIKAIVHSNSKMSDSKEKTADSKPAEVAPALDDIDDNDHLSVDEWIKKLQDEAQNLRNNPPSGNERIEILQDERKKWTEFFGNGLKPIIYPPTTPLQYVPNYVPPTAPPQIRLFVTCLACDRALQPERCLAIMQNTKMAQCAVWDVSNLAGVPPNRGTANRLIKGARDLPGSTPLDVAMM